MKQLLTQNSKMKKSSQNGITVVNWTIPAFMSQSGIRTCPNAGICAAGCYARSGTYVFSNVKSAHEAKLELTQKPEFVQLMISEIETWLKKRNVSKLYVRIHDAGDFYSVSYWVKWKAIMSHFEKNDRVKFYVYTKQVKMFKYQAGRIPLNFNLVFSFGGKQDSMIDLNNDAHSRVFESLKDLKAAGYVDGTNDDLVAALGTQKIGLVYHGAKNWTNTAWQKVS